MSFPKFWKVITDIFLHDPLAGKAELLANLNPNKIYLENVRGLLGISHSRAVQICETAVRQGLFSRGVEVLSPDGAVAISAQSESELPSTVHCWQEMDEDFEEFELPTSSLRKLVFYRLNEGRVA